MYPVVENWEMGGSFSEHSLRRRGCCCPGCNGKDAWAQEEAGWQETQGSIYGKQPECCMWWCSLSILGEVLGLRAPKKSGWEFPHTDAKQAKEWCWKTERRIKSSCLLVLNISQKTDILSLDLEYYRRIWASWLGEPTLLLYGEMKSPVHSHPRCGMKCCRKQRRESWRQ